MWSYHCEGVPIAKMYHELCVCCVYGFHWHLHKCCEINSVYGMNDLVIFDKPRIWMEAGKTSDLRVVSPSKDIPISHTFNISFSLSLGSILGPKKYCCMSCWGSNRSTVKKFS